MKVWHFTGAGPLKVGKFTTENGVFTSDHDVNDDRHEYMLCDIR